MKRRHEPNAGAKAGHERKGSECSCTRAVGMNRKWFALCTAMFIPDDHTQIRPCAKRRKRRSPRSDREVPMFDSGPSGMRGGVVEARRFPRVHHVYACPREHARLIAHVREQTAFRAGSHKDHTPHALPRLRRLDDSRTELHDWRRKRAIGDHQHAQTHRCTSRTRPEAKHERTPRSTKSVTRELCESEPRN